MDRHNFTQEMLAERLGVCQGAVSNWLRGAEPLASRAAALYALTRIPVAAWGEIAEGHLVKPAAPTRKAQRRTADNCQ